MLGLLERNMGSFGVKVTVYWTLGVFTYCEDGVTVVVETVPGVGLKVTPVSMYSITLLLEGSTK